MNVLTYNPDAMTKATVIPLGRACECRATRIDFSVASWLARFPGGTIALYIKDPNGEMYLADINPADDVASWVVRESDTRVPGFGSLELALIGANGEKKLSAVATTKLDASLVESETDAEYMQPWIERAAEIQHETETAARAAAEHAALATTSADAAAKAQAAAEAAAQGAAGSEKAAAAKAQAAADSAQAAADTLAAAVQTIGQAADDAAQVVESQEAESVKAVQAAATAGIAATDSNADAAAKSAQAAATSSTEASNQAKAAAGSARAAAASATEAGNQAKAAEAARDEADDAAETATTSADKAAEYAQTAEDAAVQAVEAAALMAPAIVLEASGAVAVIADAAPRPVWSLETEINAVQAGTGDPSPDNVRPISGRDAVRVTRSGRNLAPDVVYGSRPSVSNGELIYNVNYAHTSVVRLEAGKTYTASVVGNPTGYYYFAYDANMGYLGYSSKGYPIKNVWDLYPSAAFVSVGFDMLGGAKDLYVQIEEGGTATAYEPYQGATLAAELPETVYGGTLDWTTGTLTVTHQSVTVDGTKDIHEWPAGTTENTYGAMIQSVNPSGQRATILCDKVPSLDTKPTDGLHVYAAYQAFYLSVPKADLASADLAGMRAWLNENPLQCVAYAKAPYTLRLDPQTMDMLRGYNAIWSDAGGARVSYVADTKMYIDNAIAAIAASVINA